MDSLLYSTFSASIIDSSENISFMFTYSSYCFQKGELTMDAFTSGVKWFWVANRWVKKEGCDKGRILILRQDLGSIFISTTKPFMGMVEGFEGSTTKTKNMTIKKILMVPPPRKQWLLSALSTLSFIGIESVSIEKLKKAFCKRACSLILAPKNRPFVTKLCLVFLQSIGISDSKIDSFKAEMFLFRS